MLRIIQNGFNEHDLAITCLITFSKGFILGGENGAFAVWTKTEDDENEGDNYILERKWTALRKATVCAVNLSSNEDLLAVAFKSNDICVYEMGSVIGPATGEDKLPSREIKFEYLLN